MKIKAEETFAIVIDYQEKILPAMSGQEALYLVVSRRWTYR